MERAKQGFDGKKITALVLCAAFVAFAALAIVGATKNAGTTPAATRKGIAWVVSLYYGTDGTLQSAGTGTAWAIGKPGQPVEYFVTNGHVVEDAFAVPKTNGGSGTVDIYFSAAENDCVSAQVVYYSAPDEKDLAILKLPSPTTKREALTLRPSGTVEAGETAYALGFPAASGDRQSYTTYDQSDITITRGIISKRTNVAWATHEVFQTDVSINPGNSGGPLVDEQGFVLGVNTSAAVTSLGDDTVSLGMNYSSIIDELTKILDAEKLEYSVKGESAWMIYVFAPLAVIACACAAWLFLGKKGKASEKKREGAQSGKPVLRGVTGKYAGESFALDKRLTLGRSAKDCNIVYPADAAGISSNHCSVQYDGSAFLLTDNGSSYGTFLGNGRKLVTGKAEKLAAGDMFYLASPDNKFVVVKE